jgi:hypothetical protein
VLPIERIARNNVTFREANERIRRVVESHRVMGDGVPFLCECPREDCAAIVRLPLDVYRAVRANPRRFFTAEGHEGREGPGAVVVLEGSGFVVVEKSGELGNAVEAASRNGEDPEFEKG